MKKVSWPKLGLALVVLVLAIVGGYFMIKQGKSKQPTKQTQEQVATVNYEGVEGKNALELLKEKHQVVAQDSEYGALVSSIDGVENSSDSFWMFYVNGTLSDSAADKYATKTGDKIEWRYEKSPF